MPFLSQGAARNQREIMEVGMEERFQESSTDTGLMNVHEVAKYLRFCEAKVYKMSKQGVIPAIRIGKSWRFRKDLIDDWIRHEAGISSQVRT